VADNVAITAGSGTSVATDDVSGVHFQRVKLVDGTLDSSTAIASGGGVESGALRVTVASDSTGVLSVDDNGASLTVDNAALSVTGGGVEASALRVTIASDSTGVVSVDDNGGSLTVDGTVTANLAAGTNNIGDVDVLTINGVAPAFGSGVRGATVQRVTIATDDSLAVTNTALNAGSNSALKVEGCTAHDGTDAGNPIALGAQALAHGTNPTAVASTDRTRLYANRAGVLFTIGGHPNVVSASVRIADATGAQTDAAIAPGTIGTGTKIVVTRMTILCSNANTGNVAVKVGFGATSLPADSTTGASGVIVDHEGVPPGGGVNIGDGSGIIAIGGDGEELRLTCDDPVGGFVTVNYSYYTIES